jgi:hypothetical protein
MLHTKFRFIWQRGFRGEDFFKSTNQKQELPMKFQFICQSGFRGDDYLEINQSETRIICGGHAC